MKTSDFNIPTALQQLLSAEQAYHYRAIPHFQQNGSITFKTDTTSTQLLKNELMIILGKEIELISVPETEVDQYLTTNYRKRKTAAQTELSDSQNLLLTIIEEAKNLGSSDIHFEAFEHIKRVRFRIDGKLLERYVIPAAEYPKIINQLKVKAGLDIAEKRLPQDGRIHIVNATTEYDIRVSSLPTLHGEKLVLRLLSKDATNIQLESLGFTEQELKRYTSSVKNQHGIVLISGPTGSGKNNHLIRHVKIIKYQRYQYCNHRRSYRIYFRRHQSSAT